MTDEYSLIHWDEFSDGGIRCGLADYQGRIHFFMSDGPYEWHPQFFLLLPVPENVLQLLQEDRQILHRWDKAMDAEEIDEVYIPEDAALAFPAEQKRHDWIQWTLFNYFETTPLPLLRVMGQLKFVRDIPATDEWTCHWKAHWMPVGEGDLTFEF